MFLGPDGWTAGHQLTEHHSCKSLVVPTRAQSQAGPEGTGHRTHIPHQRPPVPMVNWLQGEKEPEWAYKRVGLGRHSPLWAVATKQLHSGRLGKRWRGVGGNTQSCESRPAPPLCVHPRPEANRSEAQKRRTGRLGGTEPSPTQTLPTRMQNTIKWLSNTRSRSASALRDPGEVLKEGDAFPEQGGPKERVLGTGAT